MYDLSLTVTVGGVQSHHRSTSFGVRKVTSRLENGHRLFTVNGIDTLILGGGYAPDLFQRRILPDRPTWQEDHIRYVKDMNLNAVRLEGKLEDDAFFNICDRNGVLVMAGWCCCSPWEQWKNWKAEQHMVAEESLRYQIRKLRAHPSLLVWLNGSDNHPPEAVEKKYLAIEQELSWPNPTLSSATAAKSAAAEPTGVKMEGPYKWEPPIYWMTDKKKGGAWGFNTEVSVHVMRLFCAGVFSQFPNLKIVIGHMGEAFPFYLWRCDWAASMGKLPYGRFSEVFRRNVAICGLYSHAEE